MNRHISLLLFIGLVLGQDNFNMSWILADNDILKISPRKTIAQTLTKGWYISGKNKNLSAKSVQLSHGIDVSAGGDSAYLVGLYSNDFPIRLEYGPNAYFESINQPPFSVKSLYEYQFNQRLSINK